MLLLKIVGALAALGLGIWLGMPGRYQPDMEEIERTLTEGTGRTRKVKRHFTPVAWIQRQISARGKPSSRRGFKLERPEDR